MSFAELEGRNRASLVVTLEARDSSADRETTAFRNLGNSLHTTLLVLV